MQVPGFSPATLYICSRRRTNKSPKLHPRSKNIHSDFKNAMMSSWSGRLSFSNS